MIKAETWPSSLLLWKAETHLLDVPASRCVSHHLWTPQFACLSFPPGIPSHHFHSSTVNQAPFVSEFRQPVCGACSCTQLCLTLHHPMDCSLPDSSIHGISQAGILEWVAIPLSQGSSSPRDRPQVSCIGKQILYHWDTWEACLCIVGKLKYIWSHLQRGNSNFISHNSTLFPDASNSALFIKLICHRYQLGVFVISLDLGRIQLCPPKAITGELAINERKLDISRDHCIAWHLLTWRQWSENFKKLLKFGMDMYTLLFLKWITNKDLLYSTGNAAQCYVTKWEKNLKKNTVDACLCV